MADVEMKDSTAGASSKGKAVAKDSADGKKKFEVKKVQNYLGSHSES